MRERDLGDWPGIEGLPKKRTGPFARVEQFAGFPTLVLREPELTTLVPLELGGVLLVTAIYCDGDREVAAHLDLLPIAGWEPIPERFRALTDTYVLFDASLTGGDLRDPSKKRKIREEHGGVLRFSMEAGLYEIETLGPWNPDTRTELYLTRMIRVTSAQI
jgi:hypothetical protein